MAIETLSPQQSQAWQDRVLPQVESVADGVWAIPVPIPHNPLVFTYCYAVADGAGLVLIDPGWDGREQFRALASAVESLGFRITDVQGVAITHYHRDHIGLVPALLSANPEMWVAMHGEDVRALKRFYSREVDLGTGVGSILDIVRDYGVPEDRRAEVAGLNVGRGAGARSEADGQPGQKDGRSAQKDGQPTVADLLQGQGLSLIRILGDGDLLPMHDLALQAMWTPGHTYGHSVFVRATDALLFSGDHVLPTITPNIGLDSGAITHSLGDYLGSLQAITSLPADSAVLPAHGFRFHGLHERAAQITTHHHERLAEIETRMQATDDHSVYAIAQGLHWSRGFEQLHHFNLFAALAETAAHMHYLGLPVGDTPAVEA